MLNLKIKIPFYKVKIFLKKLISRLICNQIHLQDGKAKVKFLFRILEKIPGGPDTGSGSGTNSKEGSGKSFWIHNTGYISMIYIDLPCRTVPRASPPT